MGLANATVNLTNYTVASQRERPLALPHKEYEDDRGDCFHP